MCRTRPNAHWTPPGTLLDQFSSRHGTLLQTSRCSGFCGNRPMWVGCQPMPFHVNYLYVSLLVNPDWH